MQKTDQISEMNMTMAQDFLKNQKQKIEEDIQRHYINKNP